MTIQRGKQESEFQAAETISHLCDLLHDVSNQAGESFSGVGLLVCHDIDLLPITSIRKFDGDLSPSDAATFLASISNYDNLYHDGFHVLSPEFKVLRISQYFSPPIVEELEFDRSKKIGGRYLAALFGSTLPGISLTGIASTGFGLAVFQNGVEQIYEPSAC